MFTEIEVANQGHCSVHNNLCPTVRFVCEQTCKQLTKELIINGKRTKEGGDLYIFITKCGTVYIVLRRHLSVVIFITCL